MMIDIRKPCEILTKESQNLFNIYVNCLIMMIQTLNFSKPTLGIVVKLKLHQFVTFGCKDVNFYFISTLNMLAYTFPFSNIIIPNSFDIRLFCVQYLVESLFSYIKISWKIYLRFFGNYELNILLKKPLWSC